MSKFKSILIVEDEPELRSTLEEVASDHFEKVYFATNGEEAYQIATKENVSIILSDITMPKLTGDSCLKKLRAAGVTTPIVFLTGNGNMDLAVTALKLGAADFLEKPFDPDHLMNTLRLAIEIEEHKKNLAQLEEPSLVRSERKTLGIKQASRTLKKTGS